MGLFPLPIPPSTARDLNLTFHFSFAQLNKIETFKDLIDDQTGAVLIESIQGEGGIFEAEDSFAITS